MNMIKELFSNIYYYVLDLFPISMEGCISILSNNTKMFEEAKRMLLENKVSEKDFYKEIMREIQSFGLTPFRWNKKGSIYIARGRFIKIIKEQREMFFDRIKINDRMKVLEEVELKGLSEEEIHVIKKGSSWNIGVNQTCITPEKEQELSQKYEYFRLREELRKLDRKIILWFEERYGP